MNKIFNGGVFCSLHYDLDPCLFLIVYFTITTISLSQRPNKKREYNINPKKICCVADIRNLYPQNILS